MDAQLQTMIANMPEKTGKSLEEWIQILGMQSFTKHSEALNFLKKEYGVTHGFANTIVHLAKSDEKPEEDLVVAQFQGKEEMRLVYDQLIAAVQSFGSDVEIAPKKAYVSIRRKKQFAIFQPTTKIRFDVGINLKGEPATDRLEVSGSFNAMVSHRVRLASDAEVDNQLIAWLRQAYELAG